MNNKFSLKFRLIFWYTMLFTVLTLVLLSGILLLSYRYYNRSQFGIQNLSTYDIENILAQNISEEKKKEYIVNLVSEVRKDDFYRIQQSSILIFVVLFTLSWGGGNLIVSEVLNPIRTLKNKIKQIKVNNLVAIEYGYQDEDLQELVASINQMIFRLKESLDDQSEFVDNASHELKTPLTSLLLQLETILSKNNLDKEDKVILERSISNVEKINDLINDLTLLAIQRDQLEFKNYNIYKIIEDSINSTSLLLNNKNIIIDRQGDFDFKVKAVKSLLIRSINNILENAIKYSPKDSTITVKGYSIEDNVYIDIIDSGKGIKEKYLTKIFDRFYRIDNSRSRKTGGRGLGLTITKTILDIHEGNMLVTNSELGGAKFTIILPKKS